MNKNDITLLQKSINEVGLHAVQCCVPKGYKILQCAVHGSYVGNEEHIGCPLCPQIQPDGNGTDTETVYIINEKAKEDAAIDELVSRASEHHRHHHEHHC